MKRLLGSLAVAVLALGVMASVSSATHSNGEGPDKDFAYGTAKLFIDLPLGLGTHYSQQHVDGMSGPQGGGGAQGHFFTNIYDFPAPGQTGSVSGDIVCLDAVQNSDVNRGVITDDNQGGGFVGAGIIGQQIDNGEPGFDDPPPDMSGGSFTPPPPPNVVCPPGNANLGLSLRPVLQGNYIVHDGI
jgi:hypothetical protein